VWAGIISDHLIGPYLLPLRLTGDIYLTFLQETLLELLEVHHEMRLQHVCAPAYCTNVAHEYLDETFGNRWIGRGGPMTWLTHSPDLTPLGFFL
jgi:hypothetical protein